MLSNSMITDFTRSYYHCWCKKYQIITDLTKLFSILKLSLWINKIQTHCTFLWVTGQVWYTWHSIQSKATLKLGLQSWTGQWWLLPSGKWREVCNFWYKLKLNKEKKNYIGFPKYLWDVQHDIQMKFQLSLYKLQFHYTRDHEQGII